MMNKEQEIEEVRQAYRDPSNPAGLSAPGALHRYFKGRISLNTIKKALQGEDSYNLHKEYHKPLQWNPFFIYHRRQLAQADLVEFQQLASQNDGVRYLLTIISAFSRKIWVYPLLDKRTITVEKELAKWIKSLGPHQFETLQTDFGKEFLGRAVQTLLAKHSIRHEAVGTTNKNPHVERVQKTLQIRIYKLLTQKEGLRFIDELPEIVSAYNRNPHRTLGYMTPLAAEKIQNEVKVRGILRRKYLKIKRQKPRYRIGQLVRLKTDAKRPSSSTRSYAEQFKLELFRIVRINKTLPVPMYYVKSLDTEEIIKEGFYGNELSAVELIDNKFKIEKVIRSRKKRRGRGRELLVKWLGFSDKWNSWINEEDLEEV